MDRIAAKGTGSTPKEVPAQPIPPFGSPIAGLFPAANGQAITGVRKEVR
jgi:hypothetical protein